MSSKAAFAGGLDVTVESLFERVERRIHLWLREVLTLMGLDCHARTAGEREHERSRGAMPSMLAPEWAESWTDHVGVSVPEPLASIKQSRALAGGA